MSRPARAGQCNAPLRRGRRCPEDAVTFVRLYWQDGITTLHCYCNRHDGGARYASGWLPGHRGYVLQVEVLTRVVWLEAWTELHPTEANSAAA